MTAPTNDRGHLGALTLDRLLLGSLPAGEASAAHAHLEACPQCQALFHELTADQRQFQASVLPRTLPRLRARAVPVPLRERLLGAWKAWVPLVVAAGAAAGLALVVARPGPTGPLDDPDLRVKGGPVLQVFAARAEAVFPVKDGTVLKPGDRIRFVVERAGAGPYVAVASIDGAHAVSLYFPTAGQAPGPLGAGRTELPGSIELDGTPGTEQLFAFFSDRPLSPDEVREALGRWPAPPDLPARLATLTFQKEAR